MVYGTLIGAAAEWLRREIDALEGEGLALLFYRNLKMVVECGHPWYALLMIDLSHWSGVERILMFAV